MTTNLEFVMKLMRDTYGTLEVSSAVSAAGVEFACRMAAELDARDNNNPLPANDALAYAEAAKTIALIKAKRGVLIV